MSTCARTSYYCTRIKTPEGLREASGRWVVVASARSQKLRRHLGRHRTPVAHTAADAPWFRVAHRIDIDSWSGDPEWQQCTAECPSHHSTNLLMGARLLGSS